LPEEQFLKVKYCKSGCQKVSVEKFSIENQPVHHKKLTFREEYLSFLRKFEISYEDQYLFEWFEQLVYRPLLRSLW